jgi:hypothetical protein
MPAQRTPKREAIAGAGTTASLLAATVGGALVVAGLLGAGAFPGGTSEGAGAPLHLAPVPAHERTAAIVLPPERVPRVKRPARRADRPLAAPPAPVRPAQKGTPTPVPAKAPAHAAHPSSSQGPPPPAASAPPQPPVAAPGGPLAPAVAATQQATETGAGATQPASPAVASAVGAAGEAATGVLEQAGDAVASLGVPGR